MKMKLQFIIILLLINWYFIIRSAFYLYFNKSYK